MSVADNFVFQFSTKGDKAAEKALQELLDVMKELKEEIVSVTKANDERQQKIKSQVSEERKATNLMFRERRFNRAEERKDRTARVREDGIRKRDAQRTLAYEHKATKEMWRMKDVKFRHEVNQRKEQERLLRQEERQQEKLFRQRMARERAEQKAMAQRSAMIRSLIRTIGVISLPTMVTRGFFEESDYARLGEFTGVDPSTIKALGYAIASVGGKEEEAKKAIGGLAQKLALIRQGHPEVAEQLYGTISRGGMALTREEMQTPLGIIEGMNRAYKKLETEDQRRVARQSIAEVTGSMAIANLIDVGDLKEQFIKGKAINLTSETTEENVKKMQADVSNIWNWIKETPRATAGYIADSWDIFKNNFKNIESWKDLFRLPNTNNFITPTTNSSNVNFVYNNNAHNTGTADQINSIQRNDVLNYDDMISRFNNLPTVGDNTMRSSQ